MIQFPIREFWTANLNLVHPKTIVSTDEKRFQDFVVFRSKLRA